jgi:hypothetical protein
MATKRVKMRKIREILRLKQEKGLPHRSIARSLHLGIGTVSEYLAKAKEVGLSWPLSEEMDDAELERRLFPSMQEPRKQAMPDFAYTSPEANWGDAIAVVGRVRGGKSGRVSLQPVL